MAWEASAISFFKNILTYMQCAYEVVVFTRESDWGNTFVRRRDDPGLLYLLNKGFRFFFRALILDVKRENNK